MQQAVHPDALTIFGATFDEKLDDEIRVIVIATGFEDDNKPAEEKKDDGGRKTLEPLNETEGEKAEEKTEDESGIDDILEIFRKGNRF